METATSRVITAIGVSGLAMALSLAAALADDIPAGHTVGAITYIAGGVDQKESDAIKQIERNFPMELDLLLKSEPKDEYLSAAKTHISDAQKKIMKLATFLPLTSFAGVSSNDAHAWSYIVVDSSGHEKVHDAPPWDGTYPPENIPVPVIDRASHTPQQDTLLTPQQERHRLNAVYVIGAREKSSKCAGTLENRNNNFERFDLAILGRS